MGRSLLLCVIILVCWSTTIPAGVYSWKDDQGVRHFSNTPPPGQAMQEENVHGKIWTNSIGMRFVYLGPGTFRMGMEQNKPNFSSYAPAHTVTLTKGFQIQVTEVTEKQWHQLMPKFKARGSDNHKLKYPSDLPASNLSSFEAHHFIHELNKLNDGGRYTIPTEAQWEYACRAGQTTEYNWGADVAYLTKANFYERSLGKPPKPKPVGSYAPNSWFLYDMHGNVWEICQEISYGNDVSIDPKPILMTLYESTSSNYDKNAYTVPVREEASLMVRGGSCESLATECRSNYRLHIGQPRNGKRNVGLRIARMPAAH